MGLTGGIGSGKSLVANKLKALGAGVVDADEIAHSLTDSKGAAMPAILAAFGAGAARPDGSLDRAAMRQAVFSDPSAKIRLEAILHPMIRAESDVQAAQLDAPYLVFAVPLLIESGNWQRRVDRVLVVDCAPETQIARTMQRSGLTRAQVLAIMANQTTRRTRLRAADDVIVNESSPSALDAPLLALHQRYLSTKP